MGIFTSVIFIVCVCVLVGLHVCIGAADSTGPVSSPAPISPPKRYFLGSYLSLMSLRLCVCKKIFLTFCCNASDTFSTSTDSRPHFSTQFSRALTVTTTAFIFSSMLSFHFSLLLSASPTSVACQRPSGLFFFSFTSFFSLFLCHFNSQYGKCHSDSLPKSIHTQ